MYARSKRAVAGIAATLTLFSMAAFADTEDIVSASDAAISARIDTLYLVNDYLGSSSIQVETLDGVVTLSGHVHDAVERRLAESLALAVDGVYRVENELEIWSGDAESDMPAWPEERSAWRARTRDANLAASVDARIAYHDSLDGTDIHVQSEEGVVTLSGVVTTSEQSQVAENAAQNTRGVSKVENELKVVEDSTVGEDLNSAATGVMEHVRDEWIEKRVERRMAFSRDLRIFDLSIEVNEQVCVLSGSVPTEAQRELATTIAATTKGVEEVVNKIVVIANTL